MKKMNKIVSLLVVFIVLVSGFLCWDNRESRFKEQIRDLQLQLAESKQKVDTFFIHDSIPVWKERIVEVERSDYKQNLADKELIKALDLRLQQVEAENRMLIAMREQFRLELQNDTVLTYSDEWVRFSYELKSRVLDCEVRDSLSTIVAREYKHRFLWFRWGTKGYNVYIVNFNPHSRVEYNKFIKVKKK